MKNENSWRTFFTNNLTKSMQVKGINPKEPNCGIFVVNAKSWPIGHTGSDPGLCSFMFFNHEYVTGMIAMGNEDLTPQNLNSFKVIWENFQSAND